LLAQAATDEEKLRCWQAARQLANPAGAPHRVLDIITQRLARARSRRAAIT
jgi:hypothetical protein